MMDLQDLPALLPWLVLAGACVGLMLMIAWRRDHRLAALVCGIGLMLSLAAFAAAVPRGTREITPLLIVDGYALFYTGLLLGSALLITLLSYDYLRQRTGRHEEYYLLLLLATLGATVMAASNHFAAFFLGLETLSIALLGLIGYPRHSEQPLEASIKYLVLSGIASAFVLFGIALVYADLGTLSFRASSNSTYWLAGVAMILTGVGFKLSVVPFHLWAPDVYQGAPAPVGGFIAVVSKSAVVALLLRYLLWSDAFSNEALRAMLCSLAILSMLIGNLLALLQTNIKRILAYSSIAHLGYLLVALLVACAAAIEAVSIYLAAYAAMTLGAFAVIALLSRADSRRDADAIEDYRGLFWRQPWLAGAFTVMLLSLAGIPLTLGFIAKFYAVSAGLRAGLGLLVAALVVGSIISLYYYLRIIVTMLLPLAEIADSAVRGRDTAWAGHLALGTVLVFLIALGTYPAPLIELVRNSTIALTQDRVSADGSTASD